MKVHLYFLICVLLWACGPTEQPVSDNSVNQTEERLQALNEQIDLSPNESSLYFERGSHFYNTKIFGEAIRDLVQCVELDSSRVDCWHLLADAYLEDNRSRPAIEALEDYLKIDPKHIPTLLKIASFQTIIKKYKPAHYHLNNILKQDKTNAEALFKKGLIYHYEQKPLQAVEYLQQSIQSDPDLVDGHLLLGQLFEEAGNPLAKRFYENAIRVAPENPEVQMALANFYWMANDYTAALTQFEIILTNHPLFAKAYFNQGLIYLELDSLNAAQKSLELAIKNDPDFIQAHYYLGETFDLKGELNRAITALEEAARLSPSDPKITNKIRDLEDRIHVLSK